MSWFSRIEIVPVEKGQILLSHLLSLRTSHWVWWWWGVGAPWGLSFFWGNLLSGEFLTKPCLEDLYHLSVCPCVYAYIAYMYVYVNMCILYSHVCRGWRLVLGVFLSSPPPYFLRQDVSLNPELTESATSAWEQGQGDFLPPPPQDRVYRHVHCTRLFTEDL